VGNDIWIALAWTGYSAVFKKGNIYRQIGTFIDIIKWEHTFLFNLSVILASSLILSENLILYKVLLFYFDVHIHLFFLFICLLIF
jgi:hypothetical protein